MARSSIRLGAMVGAGALAAGLTMAGGPASAQDFTVTTFDEFMAALVTANGNGEPDVITIALDGPLQEWQYTDALPVLEDLTIQVLPGSQTVTFESTMASAFTIGAAARFSASGVGFTGLGDEGSGTPGHGIEAYQGSEIVLDDVRLVGSLNDGLYQVGGTLAATDVLAVGNGEYGLYLEELDDAQLTDVRAEDNTTGTRLASTGGSATITRLTATANSGSGLEIDAAAGSVWVYDSLFEDNGADFPLGGGAAVTASAGAAVTLTGVHASTNTAYAGGGLWVELLGEGTTLALLDSALVLNQAITGGGIGSGGTGADSAIGDGARLTVQNTLVGENSAQLTGGGIEIWGVDAGAMFELIRSAVERNIAGISAGGLSAGYLADGAHVLVEASTLAANEAADGAAGAQLDCEGSPSVRFVDSTISGNRAPQVAALAMGCQSTDSSFALDNSTVTANETENGPAAALTGTTATIRNSIVGGNAGELDLYLEGSSASIDYSLIENPDPSAASFIAAGVGNITGQVPDIEPLADNGGPTRTHLPIAGGNVAEAGDPDFAPPPALDQRGEPRVSDRLDIGSVELQRPPHVLPATGAPATWWLLLGALALIAAGMGISLLRAC